MRASHFAAPRPLVAERLRIEGRLKPGARDLFPELRERLLASRPSLGSNAGTRGLNNGGVEAFGAPTFRNVINEKGEWV